MTPLGTSPSKSVLSALLAKSQRVWLFCDDHPGLTKTCLLLAGDALIRLELEPGVGQAFDLGEVVMADRVISTPAPLACYQLPHWNR